jgi:hypothetical protein
MGSNERRVFLETGKRRSFAGSIEWPGWCRRGRTETLAIQALFDAGPRYAQVLQEAGLEFQAPDATSQLVVVERVDGNATTDFGAPDAALSSDDEPVDASELNRLAAILESCWAAFDHAIKIAGGKELQKGPRGGGRDLAGIVEHVLMADESYLKRIGWKVDSAEEEAKTQLERTRGAILEGLAASARGELPTQGPRGGRRWSPRFFVRRVAWHVIDHTWEIEDRIL